MKHYIDLKHNETSRKDLGTAAVLTLFGLTLAAGMATYNYLSLRAPSAMSASVEEVKTEAQETAAAVETAELKTAAVGEALDEEQETGSAGDTAGQDTQSLSETSSENEAALSGVAEELGGNGAEAEEKAQEADLEEKEIAAASFDYEALTPGDQRAFLQRLMSSNARNQFTEAKEDDEASYAATSLSMNPQLVAYLTGSYHPNDRSLINAKRACHYLNGTVIGPGEEFSYNEVLGERITSRGYVLAPSITGETTEYTVGGGICQISSLLYQVCLESNMKIVERHPHTLIVPYADNGFDASVVWGQWDFRFQNPYDYPVMILAYSEDASRSVSIFMVTDAVDPLSGKRYEMRAEQTGEYAFHNYIDVYENGKVADTMDLGINSYWGSAF